MYTRLILVPDASARNRSPKRHRSEISTHFRTSPRPGARTWSIPSAAAALALALAGALVLVGCTGPQRAPRPEIKVDPGDAVIFSRVVAGSEGRAPVIIKNVGQRTLELQRVRIAGEPSAFSVEGAAGLAGARIEPGEQRVINVIYRPTVGSGTLDQDVLIIESNDPHPDRGMLEIDLLTTNSGPVIAVLPAEVDFSLVEGHRGPIELTVINNGTEPTVVSDVRVEGGAEFTLTGAALAGLPRSLAVGESFTLEVTCSTVDASAPEQTSGIATVLAVPQDPEHITGTATLYGPPVADAGADREVNPLPPNPVFLSGRGSRSLGNRITGYRWTLLSSPVGSVSASAFESGLAQTPDYDGAPTCPPAQNIAAEPCFIPDVPGTYRFALVATDERPLCALANPGAACGAASDCCGFQCGATCQGTDADGICRAGGGCLVDSVNTSEITLRALGEGLIVSVSWNGSGDFDLHLVDDTAGTCRAGGGACANDGHCSAPDTCDTAARAWRGAGDCYWQNAFPDWYTPRVDNGVSCLDNTDCLEFTQFPSCLGTVCTNTLDDPHLLRDEAGAFGPEVVELRDPIHGPGPPNVYHIGAHYFPNAALVGTRDVTVRVFYEGTELFDAASPTAPLQRTMTNTAGPPIQHHFWYVGWVEVSPAGATLVANTAPSVNVDASGFPPIIDPP